MRKSSTIESETMEQQIYGYECILSCAHLAHSPVDIPARKGEEGCPTVSQVNVRRRQNKMIATRYLSSATPELLRGNGISWIEERTGICRSRSVGRCQTRRSRTERVRDSRSTPGSVRSCSRDFAAKVTSQGNPPHKCREAGTRVHCIASRLLTRLSNAYRAT